MKIFELFGDVFVNDQATTTINKIGRGFTDTAATAAKWAVGIGAGAIAVGSALVGASEKVAATTDRIDKLSQRLGFSREGFQEWEFVLSQSGSSIESLQSGMKVMVQKMDQLKDGTGAGAEAFERLGLGIEDLEGLSQEEAFDVIVKKFNEMEDGVEKASLAQEIFSRSGQELLPLLNSNAEAVENMKNQSQELGLVLSDETIDAGVKFTDTMDQVKRTIATLSSQFSAVLMPIVQEFLELVLENMPTIKRVATTAFEVVGKAVIVFSSIIAKVIPIISDLLPLIIGLTTAFIAFKAAMLISQTIAVVKTGMIALNAVIAAQSGVMATLNAIMAANPFALVAIAIGVLVAAGVLLYKNWDLIVEKGMIFWEFLKSIGSALKEAFDGVVSFLSGFKSYIDNWFGQLRDDFVNYGKNIVLGLLDGINEAKDKVFNTISNIANAVKAKFKAALKIKSPSKVFEELGENTIDGLTKGMSNKEDDATDSVKNIASSMVESVINRPIIRPASISEQQFGSDNTNSNNESSSTSKEAIINITQNMPKWQSPQEMARAFKKETQALALGV